MSTINCTQCKDKIWDYLEGTLTETEQQEMEKHLAECDDCAEEAKEISAIMEGLHGLPLEDVPEGYHTELMKKLEQEVKVVPFKKKTAHRWKPYSLIAAAVLVVAAVGGIGGIQNFQGHVLTAEKQPATQREIAEPKEEQQQVPSQKALAREQKQAGESKKESALQPKAKHSVSSQKKDTIPEQQMQPVKKVSSHGTAHNHSSSEQPKVIKAQKQEHSPVQAVEAQPITTNTMETTMDTPMPMNLRLENGEQTIQTVVLTVEDTKAALEQLHQAGEALAIWEENTGTDFIVFSMQAEQTEIFYQKLKELGEAKLPKKTVTSEEPVFIKVVVKSK